MCFSVLWIVQTLIWLIVLGVFVAIMRLIVPYILGLFGLGISGVVMQVINIIIAAILLIALLWFLYDLYVCMSAGTGYRGGVR